MLHPLSPHDRVPLMRSLRISVFLQAAALTSSAVLLLLVIAFIVSRAELTRMTYTQLHVLATGKEDLLEHTVARQREEVAVLASSRTLLDQEEISSLLGLKSLSVLRTDGSVSSLWGRDDTALITDAIPAVRDVTASALLPRYENAMLTSYWIIAARPVTGEHIIAVFDAAPLLSLVFETASSYHLFSTMLVYRLDGDIYALRADSGDDVQPVFLGAYDNEWRDGTPAANAVSGLEGAQETRDYSGINVLVAYRSLPAFGWGIVTSIDRSMALAAVRRLAFTMFSGGLAVILLSVLVLWSMSRRVTMPLLHVQKKLRSLETKNWEFARDVFTGNEVEVVDAAAFDLTKRLRESYGILEEKVRERTKELSEAHAMDKAIFASMEHGLLVTDADGHVLLLNAAGRHLLGHDETVIGRDARDVFTLLDKNGVGITHDDHPLSRVLAEHTKIVPTPDPGHSLCRSDGTTSAVQIVASPIMQNDRCIGAVAVFRDVTEDRHIDQMKSEFITIASHQLRTPISSIRWYSEMLRGDEASLSEEHASYLREIAIANERMIRLVDALLNVTNLELGTLTVKFDEAVDLLVIMKEIDDSFTLEISQKQLSFSRENAELTSLMTCTDPVLFRLIYTNLLSNAVKYTKEKGTIVVKISRKDDMIIMSVRDDGIGIPEKEHKRVFQKLFRAENVKATDTDGTGLGLYICKSAADALGATLTFESAENAGTTFTLTLPFTLECAEDKGNATS